MFIIHSNLFLFRVEGHYSENTFCLLKIMRKITALFLAYRQFQSHQFIAFFFNLAQNREKILMSKKGSLQ